MAYHECFACVENYACPIQDAHEAHLCPCVNCLVKATCGTGCKDWDIMHDKFCTLKEERNNV